MKIGHYWGDGDVWMTPLYEALTKKKLNVQNCYFKMEELILQQ